ncbi:MAG: cellulase family glycosylhydrolase, partial [Candidatus Hydrogenedentes bacterium]|nr:cellulase family glycosylhydrolase [Candidatus Hydrogenedentota bacterium]
MKYLIVLLLSFAAPVFADDGFLRTDGTRFVDAEGRQVLLHGLCVISKSPAEDYQSWHGPEEFRAMADWGMNCIRLGIIWDGLEPAPGQYDEAYLEKVDQRIAWAKEQGLYVFLDMHQDLFSVLYSDGAPEWATIHEGKPHITGAVWSDAYLMSPAVQTAFDHFWANTPGPDGVGIQERYALAWQHVAKRYADDPTVIGYDIMNEPFMGSAANGIQSSLLTSPFADKLLAAFEGEISNPAGLMALWLTTEGRSRIMS